MERIGAADLARVAGPQVFEALDARLLDIPELPEGFAGLPSAVTSCRPFRFGVAMFGYPHAADLRPRLRKNGSRPNWKNRTMAIYMPIVIISPWAKFTTRTTPKMTERPSAIRP
jgi:hypothetical protein